MAPFVDLSGQRFGRLTAEHRVRDRKQVRWACKCDCGQRVVAYAGNLRKGATQSCGCFHKEILNARLVDLTGFRFGRLQVLGRAALAKDGNWRWRVVCDCGATRVVLGRRLRDGQTHSCGCLAREMTSARNKTLLATQNMEAANETIEYKAYRAMLSRCYNTKTKKYYLYGGMGVKVCQRWLDSYQNFLADMGRRPPNKTSLDRYPDPNGDYEPGNCRWATHSEQNSNRRPYKRIWRNKAKGIKYGRYA